MAEIRGLFSDRSVIDVNVSAPACFFSSHPHLCIGRDNTKDRVKFCAPDTDRNQPAAETGPTAKSSARNVTSAKYIALFLQHRIHSRTARAWSTNLNGAFQKFDYRRDTTLQTYSSIAWY